jgi:hypothetical protein
LDGSSIYLSGSILTGGWPDCKSSQSCCNSAGWISTQALEPQDHGVGCERAKEIDWVLLKQINAGGGISCSAMARGRLVVNASSSFRPHLPEHLRRRHP